MDKMEQQFLNQTLVEFGKGLNLVINQNFRKLDDKLTERLRRIEEKQEKQEKLTEKLTEKIGDFERPAGWGLVDPGVAKKTEERCFDPGSQDEVESASLQGMDVVSSGETVYGYRGTARDRRLRADTPENQTQKAIAAEGVEVVRETTDRTGGPPSETNDLPSEAPPSKSESSSDG